MSVTQHAAPVVHLDARDAAAGAGADALRALVRGDLAVVVLDGLLPSADFAENRRHIRTLFDRARTTRYVNGSLTTIGPYLARYLADPAGYFAEAATATAMLAEASFDLAARARAALATALGLSRLAPAVEPDGRRYADSVGRVHADGVSNPLHNDNIARDAAGTGLVVERVRHQLSCVVCIDECDDGGELEMYGRRWRPEDETFKISNGLGYDDAVVDGASRTVYRPRAEAVYLINPTYYHAIDTVRGSERVTLGFFLGFFDDELDEAVVWG